VTKPQFSNQQIREFKSRAHALKPVVRIGQHGLTDAVLAELDIALSHHELLKVKLASADRDQRDFLIETIVAKTGASAIQRIGHILVLYRAKPPETKTRIKAQARSVRR